MLLENKYLLKALNKSGYVILILEYSKINKTRTLKYISPNASIIGMNVELLNKGLKLTADYIYPEDREKVNGIIDDAVGASVNDYIHKYRMVGDDGEIYDVVNEVSITYEKDGNILLECYISKNTEKKENTKKFDSRAKRINENADRERGYELIKQDEKTENVMKAFSEMSGLYSVYVDYDGKMIFNPTGPGPNLGVFYDAFENPAYEEALNALKAEVLANDGPVVRHMTIDKNGHIIAAPIRMNGKIKGFWIVASYSDEENASLTKNYENFCQIAEFLSEYIDKKLSAEIEIAKSKGTGVKLREELANQNIITNALSKLNSNLYNSINEVIEETLSEVCTHLNLGEAFVYTRSKHNSKEYKVRNFWNIRGRQPDRDLLDTLSGNMYIVESSIKNNGGIHLVDNANYTRDSKLSIMRYNLKAVVAYPIYFRNKINGAIFFAEDRNERVFSSEELRFLKNIALIVQNMLENAYGDDNIRNVNKHLLETYNNIDVAMFVRDTHTGEVLFSNEKMNELVGEDFVGGDSREIIHDLHDKFDNLTGMRASFTQEKVTRWRSFIQKFDQIMDITEIRMEWLNGAPASLIILRKANDL